MMCFYLEKFSSQRAGGGWSENLFPDTQIPNYLVTSAAVTKPANPEGNKGARGGVVLLDGEKGGHTPHGKAGPASSADWQPITPFSGVGSGGAEMADKGP